MRSRVLGVLRADDLIQLGLHHLAQHTQPQTNAERQQPVLRRSGQLPQRVLHTAGSPSAALTTCSCSTVFMAVPSSRWMISHSPQSQRDRTRRKDRHLQTSTSYGTTSQSQTHQQHLPGTNPLRGPPRQGRRDRQGQPPLPQQALQNRPRQSPQRPHNQAPHHRPTDPRDRPPRPTHTQPHTRPHPQLPAPHTTLNYPRTPKTRVQHVPRHNKTEREGFEPSNEVNPRYAISSRARSTAPAPLQHRARCTADP